MYTEDPSPRPETRGAKPVGILLLVIVLVLLLGFDQFREWGGRAYWNWKLPATMTEVSIVNALGEPDKRCTNEGACVQFLDAFVFRNPRPAFSTYFAYTEPFPLLPILVFFQDASGAVVAHDYGVN